MIAPAEYLRHTLVSRPGRIVAACCALLSLFVAASPVHAAERFAVIVSGASAGSAYAAKYDTWRSSFVATLIHEFGYAADRVIVLADHEDRDVALATRDNVRQAFERLRPRLTPEDLLLVLLVGHGTASDDEAKFNLVGPDLTSAEWADLLKPIQARIVFVDTTGGSFPFLRRLSAARRVIITATDSAAQQFETVFPEYFLKAFGDPSADEDKNGRVSIWEAFRYASGGVRRWFVQQGQLPTERPLLDDDGDGIGREAESPGTDGALARTMYLAPEPAGNGDPELSSRLEALQRQLDELRSRKASSSDSRQVDIEIERLLVEIARLSRQLKNGR
jgi:hypothetical protein